MFLCFARDKVLSQLIPLFGLCPTCPAGTFQGQTPNTCYLINSTLVTWYEAEIFCEQRGGHLTSIISVFENQLVLDIAEAGIPNSDDYWIGGDNNVEFSPGYIGNWVWTDGKEFKYNNWVSGNPLNDSIYCASLHKTSGSWYSQNCTIAKPFICKLPEVAVIPSCPTDWTYYGVTKSCYQVLYGPNSLDFVMAKKYCEGFNSTLASIHSPQENYFVAEADVTDATDIDVTDAKIDVAEVDVPTSILQTITL
uniref:C-type lectin domain-containing protein n=1 Tax=Acrobeloides nanus TaxID=290746 RepID=A0A914E635_9BILA